MYKIQVETWTAGATPVADVSRWEDYCPQPNGTAVTFPDASTAAREIIGALQHVKTRILQESTN